MPDLLLYEQRVETVLDQMRDVRAPQRVEVQRGIQAQLAPIARERPVDRAQSHALLPLRREQRGAVSGVVGAQFADPLLDDVGGPVPDGEDAAPFRG